MFSTGFWKAAFERAIKTGAQGLLGGWLLLGETFNLLEVDAGLSVGIFLGGFALSLLTSIASAPFGGNPGGPSLANEAVAPKAIDWEQ